MTPAGGGLPRGQAFSGRSATSKRPASCSIRAHRILCHHHLHHHHVLPATSLPQLQAPIATPGHTAIASPARPQGTAAIKLVALLCSGSPTAYPSLPARQSRFQPLPHSLTLYCAIVIRRLQSASLLAAAQSANQRNGPAPVSSSPLPSASSSPSSSSSWCLAVCVSRLRPPSRPGRSHACHAACLLFPHTRAHSPVPRPRLCLIISPTILQTKHPPTRSLALCR